MRPIINPAKFADFCASYFPCLHGKQGYYNLKPRIVKKNSVFFCIKTAENSYVHKPQKGYSLPAWGSTVEDREGVILPQQGGVRRSRRGLFSPSMGECGIAGGGYSPPVWGSAAQPEGVYSPPWAGGPLAVGGVVRFVYYSRLLLALFKYFICYNFTRLPSPPLCGPPLHWRGISALVADYNSPLGGSTVEDREGVILPQHGGVRRSRRGLTTQRAVSKTKRKFCVIPSEAWESRCINVSGVPPDYFFY